MDPLAVGLIRGLNYPVIGKNDTDEDVYDRFGSAAQPIADAIRETIREEVARQLREVV